MLTRILLLVTVVIWGWSFVATKILVAELGPVEIFALRLLIGLPVVGAVLFLRRVPVRLTRTDIRSLVLGGAILTLHQLVQLAGLVTATATNSGWIIAASPLALAVLSSILLRERIGWSGVAGIVIATTGIVLLISRGHVTDVRWLQSRGDWLVLVSAHTWAVYTVATRDVARRRDPLAVTFGILLVAAVFAAVLFAARGDVARVHSLSRRGIAALLYLAVPGMALGQWCWQEGVARLGAARTGVYLYVEPLATVILAVPLLGEPLGPFTVLGGALVLAGVYVGQRDRPS